LLLGIAAITMMFTARKTAKPGALALAIAAAAGGLALYLALDIRAEALDANQGYLLLGGGWLWMCAGATMSVGASVCGLPLLILEEGKGQGKSQGKGQSRGKSKSKGQGKGKSKGKRK
jgi:hypothetical protein